MFVHIRESFVRRRAARRLALSTAAALVLAMTGAVLTYFGFMHGEAVGIGGGLGVTPAVALAYAVVAALFMGLAKSDVVAVPAPETVAAPAE